MLAEEAPRARGRLSLHIEASQEMAREVGAETFEADEETVQRHVEASPPRQGLREDGEVDLNIEVSNFPYVHHTCTFFNNKFNVSGKMYTVRVDDRPKVAEGLDAFNTVLSDLETAMQRDMPAEDYVQLRFMSNDLNNPFILPVVKSGMFDALVASEMFARILPSNAEVDLGRGNFTIDVYHAHIPQGRDLVWEFGKKSNKLFKSAKSVLRIPKELAPHCLVIAMKTGVLALEKSIRIFCKFPVSSSCTAYRVR